MYQMLCDGLDRTGVSLSDSSLAENTPPVVCLSLFTCIYSAFGLPQRTFQTDRKLKLLLLTGINIHIFTSFKR